MQDFVHRGGVCLLKSQTSLDLTSLLETNFCKVATWQNSFEISPRMGIALQRLLSIAAARYFPQALAIPSTTRQRLRTYKRQKAGLFGSPPVAKQMGLNPHDPMKSPWISRFQIGSPRFWTLMRLVGAMGVSINGKNPDWMAPFMEKNMEHPHFFLGFSSEHGVLYTKMPIPVGRSGTPLMGELLGLEENPIVQTNPGTTPSLEKC